jgi:lipopolysaccharide/colanic/teichoic acid biosynthesis glycosyltransferase
MFLVLLPFLLIVALVLKISCGQAMFLQERVGYKCRMFKVIKFCTMTNERDAEGNLLPDAERCTKIGDFLRRWSIDELPQLINIIMGDMSFIGPRPFMACYVEECTARELHRHWVKPGITGLAQIQGRNSVSYKNRFRYDVWYVENCSASVDWSIFYNTVKMILGFDKDRNKIAYDPTIERGQRK